MKRENGKKVRASEFYSFRVMRDGKAKSYSTKETNYEKAKVIMGTILGNLARGRAGLPEEESTGKKKAATTLAEFLDERFLPYVRGSGLQPKTKGDYEYRCARFKAHEQLAASKLDQVENVVEKYCADQRKAEHRGKHRGFAERTIIGDLIMLKTILKYAFDKGLVNHEPRFKVPKHNRKNERHERREVTEVEEAAYLAACKGAYLKDLATILFDCALRPEEAYRLKPGNLRSGYVVIDFGKTKAARRNIPATKRVQEIFARRCGPGAQWLFTTFTRAGNPRHIDESTCKKRHAAALKASKVPDFIPYNIRQTALTRWARRMNIYDLKYLAGHEDIKSTEIYYVKGSPEEQRKILPIDERRLHIA
jgi:integrase